jgi:hypothetical protein
MCFTKNAKPVALFAAIILLVAGLISCSQVLTSSVPETGRLAGRVGNFTEDQLALIGKVPAGALARLSTTVGSLDYDFPEFLDGIWGEEYGDIFHLNDPDDIGYSISGWKPVYGWEGVFVAVYYFDDQRPEEKGLVFADFFDAPNWCLTPPWGSGANISPFYYEMVDEDTYYLINLAKKLPEPDPLFPGYTYGQPMYDTVKDALDELLEPGVLDSMLLAWVEYERQ